jgi:DNA repair protein SbcD/Mre11
MARRAVPEARLPAAAKPPSTALTRAEASTGPARRTGTVGPPAYGPRMRLLHTSDWHLGRSLHGHDLLAAQAAHVDHLVDVVRAEGIDAVLLSGDVHDRALPPVEAMRLFGEALARFRDAGAAVVVISGNHDAPARLGDKAGLLDPRLSLLTDPSRVDRPVLLEDAHGPVAVYGVPYLEPAAVRQALPGAEEEAVSDDPVEAGAHTRVLRRAMTAVHADRARRGGRSVVLAHAWVVGGEASASERDITVGGVANVPAALFDGVDYTALGHLHRPQQVRPGAHYSGSPLPYSFGEAGHAKSSLLVELDAAGLASVTAVPAPVHRRLVALRGTLDELLTSGAHADAEDCFVAVVLTDAAKPVDAMTALRRRFPHALTLDWQPAGGAERDARSYGERLRARSDLEVARAFVEHVRTAPTEGEERLLQEALEHVRVEQDAA